MTRPPSPRPFDTGFWLCWSLGLCLWIAALVLAAPHDLRLTLAVVDRAALFGKLVSTWGEVPGWMLIAGALATLGFGRAPDSRLRPLRPLAWSVIIQALVYPALITQCLKVFWGRVRFKHLSPGRGDYTPFYVPAGVGAGKSFPSGHVAMAFVPAVVPLFVQARAAGLGSAAVAWLLALLLGFGVAWGRIVSGDHFLTDTLFSAGASLLLASIIVRGNLACSGMARSGGDKKKGGANDR